MPLDFPNIPTMISREEKDYLYDLGSKVWSGKGIIVEIGPWLGGSTYCLAAGLRDSEKKDNKKLLVFDNFIWREFMNRRSGLTLSEGDSFYAEFERNTYDLSQYIHAYVASLPDEVVPNDTYAGQRRQRTDESKSLVRNIDNEPVEILFIDGAKSWTGMRYLISEFHTHFIPNITLLVCQDYKYWGMYWVPMIIEMLTPRLELVDILNSNTVSFKLKHDLTDVDVKDIPDFHEVSIEIGLPLLSRASARLKLNGDLLGSKIVELSAIRFLVHKGEMAQAVSRLITLEKEWPLLLPDSQLLQTKKWLSEQLKSNLPPYYKTNIRRILKKANRYLRPILN